MICLSPTEKMKIILLLYYHFAFDSNVVVFLFRVLLKRFQEIFLQQKLKLGSRTVVRGKQKEKGEKPFRLCVCFPLANKN